MLILEYGYVCIPRLRCPGAGVGVSSDILTEATEPLFEALSFLTSIFLKSIYFYFYFLFGVTE